jgi:hypothetical protein
MQNVALLVLYLTISTKSCSDSSLVYTTGEWITSVILVVPNSDAQTEIRGILDQFKMKRALTSPIALCIATVIDARHNDILISLSSICLDAIQSIKTGMPDLILKRLLALNLAMQVSHQPQYLSSACYLSQLSSVSTIVKIDESLAGERRLKLDQLAPQTKDQRAIEFLLVPDESERIGRDIYDINTSSLTTHFLIIGIQQLCLSLS